MKKIILLVGFLASTMGWARENLFLIGGGARPPAVLEKFVEKSGREQARILVVTWATSDPQAAFDDIVKDLTPWNPESITEAIRDPRTSEELRQFREQLEKCTGLYFTGGDQNRIKSFMKRSVLWLLERKYHNRRMPVAGTSAGTAVMSTWMFTGDRQGDEYELKTGFNLLESSILDTHFLVRKRQERLQQAVLRYPETTGLGIDENNAIWVEDGKVVKPFGPTELTVYRVNPSTQTVESKSYTEGDLFSLP